MKNICIRTMLIGMLSLALVTSPANALVKGKDKTSLEDVPAAVHKTIREVIEGGTIGDVKTKSRNGKTVYNLDIQSLDGKAVTMQVSADGHLLQLKYKNQGIRKVAWPRIPSAVQKTLKEYAHVAQLDGVMCEISNGTAIYFARFKGPDVTVITLRVREDGRLFEMKTSPDVTAFVLGGLQTGL